jgi:hypothetical protein
MTKAATSATASSARLPKMKQTVLGLYVTAKEAYDKWKAAERTSLLNRPAAEKRLEELGMSLDVRHHSRPDAATEAEARRTSMTP